MQQLFLLTDYGTLKYHI